MAEINFDIKPLCPERGAELCIEQLGQEPKPEDRVFCPDHGTVGRRDEVGPAVAKKGAAQAVSQLGRDLATALREMGFHIERE